MMKCKSFFVALFLVNLAAAGCAVDNPGGKSSAEIAPLLQQEFDLAGERSPEKMHYIIETKLIHYALDGTRTRVDTLKLYLETIPEGSPDKGGNEYVCRKFTVQRGTESPVSIPSLEGWSYTYEFGLDEQGRVFGIDHGKFENLKDGEGKPLPADTSYFVYNTFIDFHGFCNVFAQRVEGGKGIQDLKLIGDRIIHAASFTEPPVNLGSNVAEGSTFKNGEVTLEFKGLSLVDERPCSVVTFDSGESSFHMIMEPMPKIRVETSGSSHYKGDLFIDMESYWVRKVVMGELVVSETTMPMAPHKVNSVIERTTIIRAVDATEFPQ